MASSFILRWSDGELMHVRENIHIIHRFYNTASIYTRVQVRKGARYLLQDQDKPAKSLFETHLQITVDNASQTIRDTRVFLSDPRRVTNIKISIIHQCPRSNLYT